MNLKSSKAKKQANLNNTGSILSQEELDRRIAAVEADLKSSTWRSLEVGGKFDKNAKITFISDDMLIIGCDIGSETHYMRAIDTRGRELSKDAYPFSNTAEGFRSAKAWAVQIAAEHNKKQIVVGLEPTGHYWFCLAEWMIANGISVVQVNPYAVKQTKEIEDNSQLKDDRKDPKLIANLVKDGNYGMPYLPESVYAELRRMSMLRDQLTEDRIRNINRLHREMKISFPEYMDAFGKLEGTFTLTILKEAPLPEDILSLGIEGLREIWHEARLRGRGYSRAEQIIRHASLDLNPGQPAAGKRSDALWNKSSISRRSLMISRNPYIRSAGKSHTQKISWKSEGSEKISFQESWQRWGISAGSMT